MALPVENVKKSLVGDERNKDKALSPVQITEAQKEQPSSDTTPTYLSGARFWLVTAS
jgi:hypothetical protein